MAKGQLRVRIVGDDSNLQKTLKGAGGRVGQFAKVAAAAAIGLGVAAVGAAFKVAKAGDKIAKSSAKLGVTTDAYQEMDFWASQNGISSESMERAVGRLTQRIGRAQDPADKYAKAFEAVGVATQDAEGIIRATEDVMRDTIAALRDMEDPAARSAAAAEIFGTKMARDLMPALEDTSLSLDDAAARAHELGLVMSEEAARAAEEFTDQWDEIKRAAGGFLRDAAIPVMKFLSGTVFPVIQDKILPVLRQFGQWLGPRLAEAGEMATQFFNAHVVPAFNQLSRWWHENGPTIIAAAQELWAGLQTIFGRVTDAVQMVVGWFRSGERDIGGTFASVLGFAQDVWPQVVGVVTSAVELVQAVIELVTGVVNGIWERWGETIMGVAEVVWETIQGVITGALDIIQGVIDTILGVITGDWDRAWEGVKGIVSGAWTVIETLVSGAIRVVWEIIKGVGRRIWESIKQTWADARSAVAEGINGVLDWVRGMPGRIVRALGNLGQLLRDAGRQIIEGLLGGIRSLAGSIGSAIMSPITGAVDRAKRFLKIGSPSRLWEDEVGAPMGQGVVEGLMGQADKVARAQLELLAPPKGPGRQAPSLAAMSAAGTGGDIVVHNVLTLDGQVVYEDWKRRAVRDGRRNVTTGVQ